MGVFVEMFKVTFQNELYDDAGFKMLEIIWFPGKKMLYSFSTEIHGAYEFKKEDICELPMPVFMHICVDFHLETRFPLTLAVKKWQDYRRDDRNLLTV